MNQPLLSAAKMISDETSKADLQASDPMYHSILKEHAHFDPPSLLRDRVEKLYSICKNNLDKKFPSQIRSAFASCYSELYFCTTFTERLGLAVVHPSDEGPDFYLPDLNCWVEVTTLTDGVPNSPNSIPALGLNVCRDYPKEQIMLRMSSRFVDKSEESQRHLAKRIVSASQRLVIFMNGGWLDSYRIPVYPEGGFPDIASVLLPIGKLTYQVSIDDMTIVERSFEPNTAVKKKSSSASISPVQMAYFLDTKHSHISAVIYSYANVTDSIDESSLGNDFFVIHNPLASNPLPTGSIKCGTELIARLDTSYLHITSIEH